MNLNLLTLYPTWFRWKLFWNRNAIVQSCFFISHMVQMKESLSHRQGRDFTHFISHMVQMKAPKSNPRAMSILPLYPTWFRWKISGISEYTTRCSFISHMVQMKVSTSSPTAFLIDSTLYPTWFRWKISVIVTHLLTSHTFISHMVQMKAGGKDSPHRYRTLYIPHGSDESQLKMKPFIPTPFSLYPTWFRWKL